MGTTDNLRKRRTVKEVTDWTEKHQIEYRIRERKCFYSMSKIHIILRGAGA